MALITLRRPAAGEEEAAPDSSNAALDSLLQVYQARADSGMARDSARRDTTTARDTTRGR